MTYIDKGTHCGTRIVFVTERKNDGSFHGDIRVWDNPKMSIQMASPMDDTLCAAETEIALLGALEAKLDALVREAQ